MPILMFPHNKNKTGSKTLFKRSVYRIVHSPAGIIRKR
jgi:hypothetical protein